MTWRIAKATLWMAGLAMLPGYANGFSMPSAVAWLAGSFLLIGSQWVTPSIHPPVQNRWMAALFLWTAFLFLQANLWPRLWMPNTMEPTFAYRWITSMFFPTLICWTSLLALDVLAQRASADRWTEIGLHLCAWAGVLAVYGLCQAVFLDPFALGMRSGTHNITKTTLITVFGNPMLTANALAIVAPLCLVFQPRWCRMVYGLMLLDLLLIQSAISLIAFVLSSSLVLAFRTRWRSLSLLGGVVCLGAGWLWVAHGLSSFASLSHRGEMWTTALTFWTTHPGLMWLGYGLGSVEALTTNGVWNYGSLHCEPLQVLFELGIVGFVLMLGWLWTLCQAMWRMPKNTLTVGYAAAALSFGLIACASFPLRLGNLLMVGIFLAAAIETFGEEGRHAITYSA